jgi:hypothetical protein
VPPTASQAQPDSSRRSSSTRTRIKLAVGSGARGGSVLIALAIAAIALAIIAAPASAAASRAEWVAQVEPICHAAQKPTFKAYHAFFRGLDKLGLVGGSPEISKRQARSSDRLLGTFYLHATNIYSRTTAQLSTVAPGPGDESAIGAWIAGRNQASLLGTQAGRAAKHLKVKRAFHLADRAVTAGDDATTPVAGFGLHFCALGWGEAEGD